MPKVAEEGQAGGGDVHGRVRAYGSLTQEVADAGVAGVVATRYSVVDLGRPGRRSAHRSVTAEQLALISTDPAIAHGQACVRGTRVPVSVLLDCLAAGMSTEEIVAEYPSVTPEAIRAAAAAPCT